MSHHGPKGLTLALIASAAVACSSAVEPTAEPVAQAKEAAPSANGNYALQFGGTGRSDLDRVKIPVDDPTGQRRYGADIGATDMTIELWLRARPGDNTSGPAECGGKDAWIYGNIVLDRDRFDQGRKFGLSMAGGQIVFGVTGDDLTAASLCSTSKVDDDRWHHVAVTRAVATGAVTLYVDGRQEAEVAGPPGEVSYPDGATPLSKCADKPCTWSDPFLVIGAEKHDAGSEFPSFRGAVDELRLSTALRYGGSFVPPTKRFSPDPQTAALYHFDEGRGEVLSDTAAAEGDPSNGVLRVSTAGPVWVPSDAPTGP
jgi:hypothetical protein